ncbi:hypothetical protein BYT27DRAFT_7221084 [Phlegmacium glaucopus]|nr:hypothetical protein BYT27DRAFT_7221084 [Phlegmacium glaucopus]
MPTRQPPLGSLAIQAPPSPQTIRVSPLTCHNLSVFKDILKEYRRLDDTIVMRLNRANATVRDHERVHRGTGVGTIQDQACASLWRELVGNWKRRSELLEYCTTVVDQALIEKQRNLDGQAQNPSSRRRIQGAVFEDEVKRNQVRNELVVEDIIRKRSIEGFRSRCQYFTPPLTDVQARQMWDSVQN